MERILLSQIRKENFPASEIDFFVHCFQEKIQRDISKYDQYEVLADLMNKYEFCGELTIDNIGEWIDQLPDEIRYITPDLLVYIKDVDNIIIKLLNKNPNLSRREKVPHKKLANILNFYEYKGELTSDAIRFWIKSLPQEQQNSLVVSEETVNPHLQTEFNRELNKEATEFMDNHEMQTILDMTVTDLPCIMLVDDPFITRDPCFQRELWSQGYQKWNQEVVKDHDLYKLYYINNLTQIDEMYQQLNRIYENMNQAFKITVDFGFIVQKRIGNNNRSPLELPVYS